MAARRGLLFLVRREDWRRWLQAHHMEDTEAWLVLFKGGRRSGHRANPLSLAEAVEEALCFGWIDGKVMSLDSQRYTLRFTPRRADSIWSLTNVRRVERLIREGRMTGAGLEKVAQARRSGQWHAAIQRERIDVIPGDLSTALRRRKGALAGYRRLNDSRKKQLLHWLATARRPETRRDRIEAIVVESSRQEGSKAD